MTRLNTPEAVLCVANEGNEASLQLWKIYKVVPDGDALLEGFLRVIDESGEDYLFPEEYFTPIDLPREVKKSFDRDIRKQRSAKRVSAALRRVR